MRNLFLTYANSIHSACPELRSHSVCVYVLVTSMMDYSSTYPWAKKELLKKPLIIQPVCVLES